jgi:hypothetical protein
MAKPQLEDLARAGARARLIEIEEERVALLGMFPELRGGRAPRKATASGRANGSSPARPARTRKGMSAEARKAVGERMKAYWAAKRAEKTGKQGDTGVLADAAAPRKAGRKQGRKK